MIGPHTPDNVTPLTTTILRMHGHVRYEEGPNKSTEKKLGQLIVGVLALGGGGVVSVTVSVTPWVSSCEPFNQWPNNSLSGRRVK